MTQASKTLTIEGMCSIARVNSAEKSIYMQLGEHIVYIQPMGFKGLGDPALEIPINIKYNDSGQGST